jgi:hypothetical protein
MDRRKKTNAAGTSTVPPRSPRKTRTSRAAEWPVPTVVPVSDVRAHLAAITRHAAAGNTVFVGKSEATAFSAFVSLDEFRTCRDSFIANPKNIDVESLRRKWSFEREQVENTGRPLRILRNREPRAVLVPTERAVDLKVTRTYEALDDRHIKLLGKVYRQIGDLEGQVSGLTAQVDALSARIPTEDEAKVLHQTIALARVVLNDWREKQGLPREPPSKSTL